MKCTACKSSHRNSTTPVSIIYRRQIKIKCLWDLFSFGDPLTSIHSIPLFTSAQKKKCLKDHRENGDK